MQEINKNPYNLQKPFVIGIVGISRAGKTTLTKQLAQHFQTENILHLDKYLVIPGIITEDPNWPTPIPDWENPKCYDMKAFKSDLEKLKKRGDLVNNLIIVEGFLIMMDEDVADLIDLKLYLEVDKEVARTRRKTTKDYHSDYYFDEYIWKKFQENLIYFDECDINSFTLQSDDNTLNDAIRQIVKYIKPFLYKTEETELDLFRKPTKNLLIGCSGSVATIKIPEIIELFLESGLYTIKVIVTKSAKEFLDEKITNYKDYEEKYENRVLFYFDEDEWGRWKNEKKVLHIELRAWADILLIAPLSANTLAKITHGFCDNLLTCVVRAWDFNDATKPKFFALAMNTMMYENFLTSEQKNILTTKFNFNEIGTVEKVLACGDYGDGALASPETIFKSVNDLVESMEDQRI